jgi:hypothetical protein
LSHDPFRNQGNCAHFFLGRPTSRLPLGLQKYACYGRRSGGILSTWSCHSFDVPHHFRHSYCSCFLIAVHSTLSLNEIPHTGHRSLISDASVPPLRHGYENITLSNTNKFYEHAVDFEVLTAVTMKNYIFWEVRSCSLVQVCRRFGGTYCLQAQGRRISQASNQQPTTRGPSSNIMLQHVYDCPFGLRVCCVHMILH